jgi:hypothetical protein
MSSTSEQQGHTASTSEAGMQEDTEAGGGGTVDEHSRQLTETLRAQIQAEQRQNTPPLWDAAMLPVPPLSQLLPAGIQAHACVAYQLVGTLYAYAFAARANGGEVAQQEEHVACDLLQVAPFLHDTTLPPMSDVRGAADAFLVEAVSGGGAAAISQSSERRAVALAALGDAPLLLKSTASALRALAHTHSVLTLVGGMGVERVGGRRLRAAALKVVFLMAWLQQSQGQGQGRVQALASGCTMVAQSLQEMHSVRRDAVQAGDMTQRTPTSAGKQTQKP